MAHCALCSLCKPQNGTIQYPQCVAEDVTNEKMQQLLFQSYVYATTIEFNENKNFFLRCIRHLSYFIKPIFVFMCIFHVCYCTTTKSICAFVKLQVHITICLLHHAGNLFIGKIANIIGLFSLSTLR